ncbi:MAG: rhodanese-like domain-containing protein [Gammaproteobacteria bacterium]|nr:rhodanese-like domain-containing protein [Gammaproteobacteria bacterium]
MKAVLCLFSIAAGLSLSLQADTSIPSGKQLRQAAEQTTRMIDSAGLKKLIDETPDLVLVDIRTKEEIERQGGQIEAPQNVNITRGWLEFDIQSHAGTRDTPIVIYCGGGLRSPFAAETLQKMGYTQVWNYSGGYLDWRKSMASAP